MIKTRQDTVLKRIPGDRFTPMTLAEKLNAKAILESSSFKKGKSRYSLLLIDEAFRIQQNDDSIHLFRNKSWEKLDGFKDILEAAASFADQHKQMQFPFPAGGFGFLTYEFCRFCDDIKLSEKLDNLGIPDAVFLFGHTFVIYDHYTDSIFLLGINYEKYEIDLDAALDKIEKRINDFDFNYLAADDLKKYPSTVLTGDQEKEDFLQGVAVIKAEIVKGNLLQAVLSRKIMVKTDMPAIRAYKNLRTSNPSPYMFYIDFGDYQLLGSSPEVHAKVKDSHALLRPIAGTRRRGESPEADTILEKELLGDPKEESEHLMLVDLARNDLGRVCLPNSVKVTEYRCVEYYSHVMHIVSEVQGELSPDFDGLDALRAAFPAGTVSGAPKIQAIKTLDSLEKEPRRFYAGIVCYLEPDGNFDSCITIRSCLKKDGVFTLQAGAGIVYDSKPEREYEETREKLLANARAIGVEI